MKIIILLVFLGMIMPVFAQNSPIGNDSNQLENQTIPDNLRELESVFLNIATPPSDDQYVSSEEYAMLVERLTMLENENTNDSENLIPLISGIAVAGGTIALAVATFLMIRQSNSQLEQLRQQNLLTSSKNEPILKVSDFKFIDNKSQCRITNVGDGRAIHIGMSVHFIPSVEKQIKIDAKIEFDGEPANSQDVINFPIDQGMIILDSKETMVFSSEMLFGIGTKMKIGNIDFTTTRQAFTFDKLKEFLKKFEIFSIAVDIGVIGKDYVEKPTPVTRIATFFVDFKKHKTLQEAYEEAITNEEKPYFFSLTQGEIDWMDGDLYKNSRTQEKSDS